MNKSDFPALAGMGLLVLVLLAAAWGWVANIITLAHGGMEAPMIVLRAVGILVAPLGVVLGYI